MAALKALPLVLGVFAVAATTAIAAFDIIYAVTLNHSSTPQFLRIISIIAAGLASVTVVLASVLLGRQVRYRNGMPLGNQGHQHTYFQAGFGGIFGLLSAVATALLLGTMQQNLSKLPMRILGTSTRSMVLGCFVVWAVSLLSQTTFVICMILVPRKEFQRQIQRYSNTQVLQTIANQTMSRPQDESDAQEKSHRGSSSTDSKFPPTSSNRSRSGSDTMASIRSSLNNMVRPMDSKTKLISPKTNRSMSLTSSHHEPTVIVEDGFDSWDYSSIIVETVVNIAPSGPRFLETIPASPTTSRSNSPGFPLDLEPPRTNRSRSYSPSGRNQRSNSPSASIRESRPSRNVSPVEPKESNIHPLFRSGSPTPPPAATPGTIVTAAPGAGQIISDRASIRSMGSRSRLRSGSLPGSSSPLAHSASMDSIRRRLALEEQDQIAEEDGELETGSERTITPPIPQWIMEAGKRSSMGVYQTRKKNVGQARDAI